MKSLNDCSSCYSAGDGLSRWQIWIFIGFYNTSTTKVLWQFKGFAKFCQDFFFQHKVLEDFFRWNWFGFLLILFPLPTISWDLVLVAKAMVSDAWTPLDLHRAGIGTGRCLPFLGHLQGRKSKITDPIGWAPKVTRFFLGRGPKNSTFFFGVKQKKKPGTWCYFRPFVVVITPFTTSRGLPCMDWRDSLHCACHVCPVLLLPGPYGACP